MELHHSVSEFFHEAVTEALKAQHLEAAEPTEFYLVNLLVEFTSAARVDDEPLALKLAQATGASPDARARALKEVGDTSLYVSGFFADSLARKTVDVDYYMSMGGTAYGQLAGLVTQTHSTATEFYREAYDELAAKFPQFVDVLAEIRAGTHIASSTNVLRLYEEWMRTRSEWIERRLRATGLLGTEAFDEGKIVH